MLSPSRLEARTSPARPDPRLEPKAHDHEPDRAYYYRQKALTVVLSTGQIRLEIGHTWTYLIYPFKYVKKVSFEPKNNGL